MTWRRWLVTLACDHKGVTWTNDGTPMGRRIQCATCQVGAVTVSGGNGNGKMPSARRIVLSAEPIGEPIPGEGFLRA